MVCGYLTMWLFWLLEILLIGNKMVGCQLLGWLGVWLASSVLIKYIIDYLLVGYCDWFVRSLVKSI